MKIVAKKDRKLLLINTGNTQNENKAETIELTVPEEYEDYNKKIVFVTDDGIVWDIIQDNTYKLTKAITKYKQVDFYIWLTKGDVDFRTETRPLRFYYNKDASDEITPEEISGVNTVVNILEEEITKVDSLETELRALITDIQNKLDNGEFDGEDGYTPQKGIDYFTEQDIEEIETDVKNNLEENVLVNYSLTAETGAKIELSINPTDYKLTAILKDKNNNIIHTSNVIDLPLETMVVNATYNNVNKAIILTLQNGTTVSIGVADLVRGLVSESQLQTILSNFYTKTEINTLLNNKVDKVQGKELSSNDFTDTYKNNVDSNTSARHTHSNKTVLDGIASSDITNWNGKQNATDNSLTTINKTIVGAINEVDSIAKGANQALSYSNYSAMITAFNSLANNIYNIGQNIMIVTLEVPDLWISSIESTSSVYTYVDDETFVNSLATDGYVQVGYYKLSALETQKVNLDDYVTKTENKNKADIINNELIGSTVYFTDGINNSPVNKLMIDIAPVQEGSGTPAPNNVRNITGWNGAIINHSGADTQNPETLNISWQNEAGTVYVGTLDLTTGVLRKIKELLSLRIADMDNEENYPGWKNAGAKAIMGSGYNSIYKVTMNAGTNIAINTKVYDVLYMPKAYYNNLTQSQWKEQYPNLTLQILLPYSTPIEYQLTPREITTLLGTNNFWANTGDVTVNYKADTKLYIDSKFELLEDRLSLLEG